MLRRTAARRRGLTALMPLLVVLGLCGCGLADGPIASPKGPIALAERDLLYNAFALMMIVAVPVYILTFVFLLRYRRSKPAGRYTPSWRGSWQIEAVVWLVPAIIVIILGVMLWTNTQRLDPYKSLGDSADAFEVQAIAQDWKWLFVYPELGIASVNELAFPADRPLRVTITSDTVMNSFMIPALGGQIYAMAGMTSRLNLIADAPGVFTGRNTMYSGEGFSDQHFQAHAMTDDDFAAWTETVKSSGTALDAHTYVELAKPSVANPVSYYSTVEDHLFHIIISKYAPAHGSIDTEAASIIRGSAT